MAIGISIIRFLIKFSVFGGVCFGIVYGILYVLQKVNQAILGNDFSKVSKGSGGSKHVMITGGSSGIGLEIARIYLTRGDKVTIIARNEKKLFEAVEELKGSIPAGKRTEDYLQYVSCDVGSSEEAVKSSLAPSIKKFGDVDILVNSAGTSIAAPFDELDSKEFERMFKINVLGSVYPTRVVLPAMKEKKRGKIIFVSSQVAQAAIYGYTAYGASKWALRGLAEALQMEVKPFNIQICVAYPPDTDTPGYKEEMLTKPLITKKISESGSVFTPVQVAQNIVEDSEEGYYTISTGVDGWFLKQGHAGMTPMNNLTEVAQQIIFSGILRLVGVFYMTFWNYVVKSNMTATADGEDKKSTSENDKKKN